MSRVSAPHSASNFLHLVSIVSFCRGEPATKRFATKGTCSGWPRQNRGELAPTKKSQPPCTIHAHSGIIFNSVHSSIEPPPESLFLRLESAFIITARRCACMYTSVHASRTRCERAHIKSCRYYSH